MWMRIIYLFVFHVIQITTDALWDVEVMCPLVCTCRLERLGETAIYRFMQTHQDNKLFTETDRHINNDVLYEEDLDDEFLGINSLLRAVTCILQTEVAPSDLLQNLPKDIESLTLIQGAESGNKSVSFSWLEPFSQLIILELHGVNMMNEKNGTNFFCEIDTPLHKIKYLNLDKILIKASKKYLSAQENEINQETVTFEYTQQLNPNLHPLTMVQKGRKREILPYSKYKEAEDVDEIPLFLGFNELVLLRISGCQLNNVNWEMFDGLHNLEYLILEKNNLMFIPDFAFYGTPNLKSLSLAWNNLLNIQITDLAGLLELEYLDLSHNNFSQLSELSFPPFPKLKLANFGNNPINIVFPSTFEVMNTTDSLILGGEETPLTLIANSFLGLKMLKKLTLKNLIVPLLKRELLFGMPNLNELIMSGNISRLEFDTFLDVPHLDKLVISSCSIKNISMDAFIGLNRLQILDISQNSLESLPPGVFDPLKNLRELYLNGNKLRQLPKEIFSRIHPKMIRLTQNPWHCSCGMSDWKPIIVNKIKQKAVKNCDASYDKGFGCNLSSIYDLRYVFDTRVAPKCATPKKFLNWNVFHVMRKQLKCLDYKPKIRKRINSTTIDHKHSASAKNRSSSHKHEQNSNKLESNSLPNNILVDEPSNLFSPKIDKLMMKPNKYPKTEEMHTYRANDTDDVPVKITLYNSGTSTNNENNDLNSFLPTIHNHKTNKNVKHKHHSHTHGKKYRKHRKHNNQTNSITEKHTN